MTDNAYDGEASSPWAQKGFIAAAVVVALLVVLGVVVVLSRPSGDGGARSNRQPPATTAGASQPASTSPDGDSVCGLPAGDQTVPTTAPPGTRWELVGTMATPTAPKTHGPGRVQSGLRSCFAHTPTGALYSAINFFTAASSTDLLPRAARDLTAAGAGRDRAIREAAKPDPAGGTSGSSTQLAGFTFLNYTQGSSTVDLAFRVTKTAGTTSPVHIPLSLRWENGDWKVSLPATGEIFPGIGAIPDLTGYVPWSGT
jgi:hypothetical protein